MTTNDLPLSKQPAYADLVGHSQRLRPQSIEGLFASDDERCAQFSLEAVGLQLDFSKHLLDRPALNSLLQLAQQSHLPQRIAALFAGDIVNPSENRPALHTLLRANEAPHLQDKLDEVSSTIARMHSIADRCNDGQHTGFSGERITDVINIGIGGSDLGPRLVSQALKPFHGSLRSHYVANVDPADLDNTLAALNPKTTLFIICSKSFRTEETLANALTARAWMLAAGASEKDLDKHFLAVTTNLEAAASFGISEQNCLPLWDWVGGRYSVWSAIGLSCAIGLGSKRFAEFLAGARAMDEHFRSSELAENLPVILALLEVWYCSFFGASNHVVLPYDHGLRRFPDFLQQLTMESNGKSVSAQGRQLEHATAPILWGSAGTIGQHSFHQLLHQGTQLCPADFIVPLTTQTDKPEEHRKLVANGFAQSAAMMVGRTLAQSQNTLEERGVSKEEAKKIAPHLVMRGNRPNSMITLQALTPYALGALIALYEHRTYCSSQIWGINPFDQWGVELGKEIGTTILGRLSGEESNQPMDASTERLIRSWRDAQR